jgi:hypothetical protein
VKECADIREKGGMYLEAVNQCARGIIVKVRVHYCQQVTQNGMLELWCKQWQESFKEPLVEVVVFVVEGGYQVEAELREQGRGGVVFERVNWEKAIKRLQ